ncbi:hypothetical protein OF83DRAFT_1070095 [Amylostereum chailletii]|nr:hypothetical protein OF83DRAFT_1070095 [Amylostereum chailletii]
MLPSTSLALAYSLPLLLISLLLAFAGSFLTLERTRAFAPQRDAFQLPGTKKRKLPRFYLEGGVGGLASGYAFGLHLSTLLSLLIPNVTTSAALSSKAFVAVWILSCLPTAILAGRFKYAALAFIGITGGTSLSLSLSIALHPSLLTRRVFFALFVPIFLLFSVLPIARTQQATVRLAAAATGTFGFIVSVAILAHVPTWANVWERLWVSDGASWGTSKEHGLTAGFFLVLILGCASDWAFKRYFGGNPDQKWDSYLAEYTTSLPHSSDRAGTFRPDTSTLWDRLLHPFGPKKAPPFEPVYPLISDVKYPTAPSPHPSMDEKHPFDNRPRLLRKESERPLARLRALARTENGHKGRETVKFQPLRESVSDESDDDDDPIKPISFPPRPLNRRSSTHTSTSKTLTNGSVDRSFDLAKETARLSDAKRNAVGENEDAAPEYSDYEEDVTSLKSKNRDEPGWLPPFLAQHQTSSTEATLAPPGTVPLTPSLIHAIDRINSAQAKAYGPLAEVGQREGMPIPSVESPAFGGSKPALRHGDPNPAKGEQWDSFWKDVTDKAVGGVQRR